MTPFLLQREAYIPFPAWAKRRKKPWIYIGWIKREPGFEKLCQSGRIQDHGERRAIDIYREGAACWVCEPSDWMRFWQRVRCFVTGHSWRDDPFTTNLCRKCAKKKPQTLER
jgi:hypothetical protein